MSDAALARAAEYGDGWFAMASGALPEGTARLAGLAAARKRPVPPVTVSMLAALKGDPALPDEDTLIQQLSRIDGPFGIPAEYVRQALVAGGQDEVAAQLADSAKKGASRVVVSFAGGDWNRQAELLAGARPLLD
jgi:alkanesulfonate monooxygenase SsuD/methylene tetrahydromethanopterin reductase-like flavin-dependent oxidoreductase (luciferase family)